MLFFQQPFFPLSIQGTAKQNDIVTGQKKLTPDTIKIQYSAKNETAFFFLDDNKSNF